MKADLVVIGSTGQLGTDLVREAEARGITARGLGHDAIEIVDPDSVERALGPSAPRVVLNTAATHGADSYAAEDQLAFFRTNTLGPWFLSRWCATNGATLVHYGTDYVFGGTPAIRPLAESDAPAPLNAYGASKLAGEHLVAATCPAHYLLRVSSLYGHTGCRAKNDSNFVKTILDRARRREPIRVVNDQVMSPTCTRAIAAKTLDVIERRPPHGLYHMGGAGSCSWFELAEEVVKLSPYDARVEPIASDPEPAGAPFVRPRYTALDNAALRRHGLGDLPPWRESLAAYVKKETEERVEVHASARG